MKFEAWMQVVATVQLDDHWVKAFTTAAKKEAETQEREAQRAQYLSWTSWLQEGPAAGLKRQHQFTKVKSGWVESALTQENDETQGDEGAKHEDGLSPEQLKSVVKPPDVMTCRPATMQEETDSQATAWRCEWGSNLTCIEEPQWPEDIGCMPEVLLNDSIVQAALTFPKGTGLGWDGVHPRVLTRVSPFLLRWIARVMAHCEKTGRWHKQVNVVIIVLLPKGDGTYRPIGLLPWLPRLWMRARRIFATAWERANDKSWIYAGVGKGADIAAWKQAARAELASTAEWKSGYAQALLGLVKAFEKGTALVAGAGGS